MITTKDHLEYSIIVGQLSDKTNSVSTKTYRAVAIAYSALHNTIEVPGNDRTILQMQTFINYTNILSREADVQAAIPDLKVLLRDTVKRVLQLSSTSVQLYHDYAWDYLWRSGFSITHSHAPNAINGYQINATIYYLLSQRQMAIHSNVEPPTSSVSVHELISLSEMDFPLVERNLYQPDRCYNGHSTLTVKFSK